MCTSHQLLRIHETTSTITFSSPRYASMRFGGRKHASARERIKRNNEPAIGIRSSFLAQPSRRVFNGTVPNFFVHHTKAVRGVHGERSCGITFGRYGDAVGVHSGLKAFLRRQGSKQRHVQKVGRVNNQQVLVFTATSLSSTLSSAMYGEILHRQNNQSDQENRRHRSGYCCTGALSSWVLHDCHCNG